MSNYGSGSIDNVPLELIVRAINESVSGIIITDNLQPDNPIIYCNTAFEKLTGYTRPEIIGHNCRFLQKQDLSQKERFILKEAIVKGESAVVEIRNYKKNGALFWNELRISPVRDQNGVLTNFIGVQHDITEKREALDKLVISKHGMEQKVLERTKKLKDEREFTESVLETVRESLIVLDSNLNVLSVNEHFLRTFKVSRIETVKLRLYDLGNGQWNIEKLKELLEQVLPTNNPVLDFEVQHNFPHIGRKIMLLNAFRIELEGEYKNRILLAIEDITERRSIEIRKDDFLSIASHELKTPLTSAKGYIQMLKRFMHEDSTDQFKGILDKAERNVERLNNLIAELLDVSKIQSGNIELHMAPFDFGAMLRETIDAILAANPTYNIKLSGQMEETVIGDESNIAQVVTNLISNAIKYAPHSKDIEVYIARVSNYVKVSVQDYGMGISKSEQSKIFGRFYRVSDIQKKYPGMGIGLYICEQIISNHKGSLWVESEPGNGATFSFTIPVN
ncbi:hypothetical protein GCM10027516_22940 [Niabella aquatica]